MKKKRKKIGISHLIIGLVAIYVVSILFNQQRVIRNLNRELMARVKEVEKIEREIKDLEGKMIYKDFLENIDKIGDGTSESKITYGEFLEYIERIARDDLKMIKSGELIYIDRDRNKDKFMRESP